MSLDNPNTLKDLDRSTLSKNQCAYMVEVINLFLKRYGSPQLVAERRSLYAALRGVNPTPTYPTRGSKISGIRITTSRSEYIVLVYGLPGDQVDWMKTYELIRLLAGTLMGMNSVEFIASLALDNEQANYNDAGFRMVTPCDTRPSLPALRSAPRLNDDLATFDPSNYTGGPDALRTAKIKYMEGYTSSVVCLDRIVTVDRIYITDNLGGSYFVIAIDKEIRFYLTPDMVDSMADADEDDDYSYLLE